MKLRHYQQEAVSALYDYFTHAKGNPVVAMPTGTGKSIVIGDFVRGALTTWPKQRIMVLTHVKELIAQNFQRLLDLWPLAPAGIYSAGLRRKEHHHPITYAGIASVYRRAEKFGHIDLVFVDEAHLLSAKDDSMYDTFLGELLDRNPKLKVVGLSATPYRLGQGLLTEGGFFTDICFDLCTLDSFNRLIAEGWIVPLIPKKTGEELDVSNVGIHGGEFISNELQAAVDHAEVTRHAVREIIDQSKSRRHWLIFASGIRHAEHVAEEFRSHGIASAAVHSKIEDGLRDRYIEQFRRGELTAIVNNNVLTTGFDMPGIDLIGMLRPTQSPGLWVQMLGRGTRPCAGKNNCLVLDFARNTERLGPINDPVLPRKKGEGGGGAPPVKMCPVCFCYNHAAVRHCISCGYEFQLQVKLVSTASSEALLARNLPQVEVFPVRSVEYSEHRPKDGRTSSLLVAYICGPRIFNEWVCLEHIGYPQHKAHMWWIERSGSTPPETVLEALTRTQELAVPKKLRVWTNRRYPEVVGYDFSGDEFEE